MGSIGERLYDLRVSRELSQEEVAAAVGISRVALTRYENGQRMAKMNIVMKLAAFFDVSVDYLIGDEKIDVEEISSGLSQSEREAVDHLIWILKNGGDRSLVEHALLTIDTVYKHETEK